MHEIEYRIASEKDIDLMMISRLEMLRVVNGLDADYQFSEDFIRGKCHRLRDNLLYLAHADIFPSDRKTSASDECLYIGTLSQAGSCKTYGFHADGRCMEP